MLRRDDQHIAMFQKGELLSNDEGWNNELHVSLAALTCSEDALDDTCCCHGGLMELWHERSLLLEEEELDADNTYENVQYFDSTLSTAEPQSSSWSSAVPLSGEAIQLSGEETDEDIASVRKDEIGQVLDAAQKATGFPLLALVDLQRNTVYLKTVSGLFVCTRPSLTSFFDWILNLHVSIGAHASYRDIIDKSVTCSKPYIVDDTSEHGVLRFSQNVQGPPRIRALVGYPVHGTRPNIKDHYERGSQNLVGFLYAMNRLSGVSGEDIEGGMASFAWACGDILGPGKLWEYDYELASRKARLNRAFCAWHLPLMVVKTNKSDETSIEMCNNAFMSYFAPMLTGQDINFDSLQLLKPISAQYAAKIHTYALFEGQEQDSFDIPRQRRASIEICRAMILSSLGIEEAKTPLEKYFMVYASIQKANPIPASVVGTPISDISSVILMRDVGVFSCRFNGNQASLQTFRCLSDTMATSGARVIDAIMSLDHPNILPKIASGISSGHYKDTREFWMVQKAAGLGNLDDLINSGAFSVGSLRPLVVALSALDLAKGIQQLHNASLVYGELHTQNIFVQPDPNDMVRGWRLVLGIPDIYDNLSRLDVEHEDLCAFRTGRTVSSCPERVLGQNASLRTDSYAFGIIIWELWEGSSAWPQINDEQQLIDKFCYEKDAISKYRLAMPQPLSTIFSMCIGHKGMAPITNETIITLLQDFVTKLQETQNNK